MQRNPGKRFLNKDMYFVSKLIQIRDCVWAPIRRDTMAKLNKAKTVGEDSVVFTEVIHFVFNNLII